LNSEAPVKYTVHFHETFPDVIRQERSTFREALTIQYLLYRFPERMMGLDT
jgi:hypothetical protein